MARRKRASMREGPLADLFRSTVDDPPADPPEAPEELSRQKGSKEESDPDAPRYGRRDPAAETPEPGPAPEPGPGPDPGGPPSPPEPVPPSQPDPTPEPQIRAQEVDEDDPLAPPTPGADVSNLPNPKERLSRIFGDAPRHQPGAAPAPGAELARSRSHPTEGLATRCPMGRPCSARRCPRPPRRPRIERGG